MSLVGKKAPEFKMDAVVDGAFKSVTLADYNGKWLVMFFYPLDFTFVCPTEITAFSDRVGEFQKLGAEVVGVSVDSKFSHLAWINTPRKKGGLEGLKYPLAADISKKTSRDFGVLLEDPGIALRGLYLIDPKGVIQYEVVHNLGVGRSVDEALRVLQAFQTAAKTGEVCPAGWAPGKATMKPDPKGSLAWFEKAN